MKVLHWSSPSTEWRTLKENKFLELLHKKAQIDGKSPQSIIDSFPSFLQPLARRILSHPHETIAERANALGMTRGSASVLGSTNLRWLVGGPRPQTGYTNSSTEDLVELTRTHLEESESLPASLRNELWYRKYCLTEPVDIVKIARHIKKLGKRSIYQQMVFDAIQDEIKAGKKLKDIILHVRKQLGGAGETYVLNAISSNPVQMPKLGIKFDSYQLKKLGEIIRGGVLPERKKVTNGLREGTTKLFSLPASQKDQFMRTLNPFELHLLTQRGLQTPPASLGDLTESIERFGEHRSKFKMTVLRIEKALSERLRVFLDSVVESP